MAGLAGVVRELASVTVTAVAHGRHFAEPGAIPGRWRPSSVAVTLRDASSRVTSADPTHARLLRAGSNSDAEQFTNWLRQARALEAATGQ